MSLTTEELVKRGYPARPEDPEALATWLKAVTHPATFVPARSVARPERRHSTRQGTCTTPAPNSCNWSGFALLANPNQSTRFDYVTGEWYVPSVSGELNMTTYSSFWVGLDGTCSTCDLWQAGTEQDITVLAIGPFGMSWVFTTYDAWSEFLPQQPTEQVVANFAVNPGDDILMNVWIGTAPAQWPPSLAGMDGIAQIENYSRASTRSSIRRGATCGCSTYSEL